MQQEGPQTEHLSEYERAICYYSLPKAASPVTTGLVAAYAVCLLEALVLLGYGVAQDSETAQRWGLIALVALVLFGVVAFPLRSLVAEVRRRRLLATARSVPDATSAELPDPFANHILLRHARYAPGQLFAITSDDATIHYFVDTPAPGTWNLRTEHDEEVCQVRAVRGPLSFAVSSAAPSRLVVRKGGLPLGMVQKRFSFSLPWNELLPADRAGRRQIVREGSIYENGRVVGRLYHLRGYLYLDVERDALTPLLTAYFASAS